MTGRSVLVLLGRQPGPLSLLPAVVTHLRVADAAVEVRVIDDRADPRHATAGAAVIVIKHLADHQLDALATTGAPCCNPAGAALTAADRISTWLALRRAGAPVPDARIAQSIDELRALAAVRAVVVKTARGSRGSGILHMTPAQRFVSVPLPGPWLVQERVASDGWDRKLYVTGEEVRGVLRRWPADTLADKLGNPMEVTADLARVAVAAGETLGLHVYGVDVLVGPDGPTVVDVNPFPGFKGVPVAPALVAAHLLSHVRREVPACAS